MLLNCSLATKLTRKTKDKSVEKREPISLVSAGWSLSSVLLVQRLASSKHSTSWYWKSWKIPTPFPLPKLLPFLLIQTPILLLTALARSQFWISFHPHFLYNNFSFHRLPFQFIRFITQMYRIYILYWLQYLPIALSIPQHIFIYFISISPFHSFFLSFNSFFIILSLSIYLSLSWMYYTFFFQHDKIINNEMK